MTRFDIGVFQRVKQLPRYKELEAAIKAIEDEIRPLEKHARDLRAERDAFVDVQYKALEAEATKE